MIPEIIAISGAFGLNKYAFLNATGDTPQSEWHEAYTPQNHKHNIARIGALACHQWQL